MPLSQGQVINNRYRNVKLLGQGGFGAVYKAWDLNLKKPCALKENSDVSPEAVRQFEREAVILAKLRHPNLPVVIDHFQIQGQGQYLVMDYIEGKNLEQIIITRKGPIGQQEAIFWIDQICDAVSYLHSQSPPIIHRDIKPLNIIIDSENKAMLVDFGISKIYEVAKSTSRGARGISPGYSPPEQYGTGSTDEKSDQYSLAATLSYILTAKNPPDAVDVMVNKVILPSPKQFNPNIDISVNNSIIRAMSLYKEDRFASISEFQFEMRAIINVNQKNNQINQIAASTQTSNSTQGTSIHSKSSGNVPKSNRIVMPRNNISHSISRAKMFLNPSGLSIRLKRISWYCVITGLIIPTYGLGLIGFIGGLLLLYRKKLGWWLSTIHLIILVLASLFLSLLVTLLGIEDTIIYFLGYLIIIPVLIISIYCLIHIFKASIKTQLQ